MLSLILSNAVPKQETKNKEPFRHLSDFSLVKGQNYGASTKNGTQ